MVFWVDPLRFLLVCMAGVYLEPTGAWVKQVGRGLLDRFGGVLAGRKYLIHDRGTVFSEKFSEILKADEVKTLKLPARSLSLNSHLEKWNRSIREERPHQRLGNEIIEPQFRPLSEGGELADSDTFVLESDEGERHFRESFCRYSNRVEKRAQYFENRAKKARGRSSRGEALTATTNENCEENVSSGSFFGSQIGFF